jgi:HAE1 family hydrophobic/amphiphilic exporter-1
VGGLIFSQLMTLYLTPVVYTYMSGIMETWKDWKQRRVGTRGQLVSVEP